MTTGKTGADALVTFLLDRTESMRHIKGATIEAFNGYLSGLQNDPDGILFTMLQFDTISIDKLYVAEPVKNVKLLTDKTFQPRAATPLIDAAVKTIRAVETSLKQRDDNPKIIVCIQTDGQENSSREHSWDELNDLIKEKTKAGWEFLFLGVGIDAYQQGMKMGMHVGNTVSTTHDPKEMRAAYGATASNTMDYVRGRRTTMVFTEEQKFASGDAFDPARPRKPVKMPPVTNGGDKLVQQPSTPIVEDFKL